MCRENQKLKDKTATEFKVAAPVVEEKVAAPVHAAPIEQKQKQGGLLGQTMELLPGKFKVAPLPSVLERGAEPMPEQPIPAAEMTYKQRKKLKKMDEKAKARCPYADHQALQLEENMLQYRKEIHASNAMGYAEQAKKEGRIIDGRVMGAFCQGYKTDKKGKPLNEEEAKKQQADKAFLEDYSSGDLQKRMPHLERIKNDLLKIRISPVMFTWDYISKHTSEVYSIVNRFTYFENMQKDPINKPFFEQLPEIDKKLLKVRVADMTMVTGILWSKVLALKGIAMNGMTPEFQDNVNFHRDAVDSMELLQDMLADNLEKQEQKEAEIREQERERLEAEHKQKILELNQIVSNINVEPDFSGTLGGQEAIDKMNYAAFEQERTIGKDTFKGVIEHSNHSYRAQGEAGALVDLELRSSGQEMAKAHKQYLGTYFDGITKDYTQMVQTVYDAGLDFETMSSQIKTKAVSEKYSQVRYATGGGVEVISNMLFTQMEQYILSPQTQQYINSMWEVFKDAEVFQKDKGKLITFFTKTLVNMYGANYQIPIVKGKFGDDKGAVTNVLKEACRNLLTVCRTIDLEQTDYDSLPKEMKALTERCRGMIQNMLKANQENDNGAAS